MNDIFQLTQGFPIKKLVSTVTSKMVLMNDQEKHILENPVIEDGFYYLKATAEETATWSAGRYQFQILDDTGIVEHGDAYVLVNFALDNAQSESKSRWQIVLEAVDATLAGKATAAQSSVTIGDKTLVSMSVTELLKLRDFIKGRIAEEMKEKGEDYMNPNDQHRITYIWRR